jgi:hypothetical protein
MKFFNLDLSIAFVNVIFLSLLLLFIVWVMFYLRKDNNAPLNINLLSFALMIVFILAIVYIIFYTDFFPGCKG